MEQLNCIAPDVRRCFHAELGAVLTVRIMIDGGTGRARLSHAQVGGTALFDDTDVRTARASGQYLERAVERLRFTPFESPTLEVNFPYKV